MARDRKPSKQMKALLAALERQTEGQHGYQLIRETGLLSGTLYPLLMRMADQGLVDAEWQEPTQPGRPARHVYRLTAQGRALARSVGEADRPAVLAVKPA